MKTVIRSALVAGLMLGAAASQPAMAQAPTTGTVVQGLAYADLQYAANNCNANKAAAEQRKTYYKAQFDAAQQRKSQIEAQLKPLYDKINADSQAANPNQQSLQQQAQTIQQIEQSGQQELQRIMQPVALSQAYVSEQISDKLEQATRNAMAAKKVSLLLRQEATLLGMESYDLTDAVIAELDKLIPTAQLVPPQGWEPRQVREAKAAQAAQQQAATAGPQVQGR